MTSTTVLVTGATGTVGSALVPALQARGVAVRAMIRDAARPVPGAENVVADSVAQGLLVAPIGDAPVSVIDTRDIADVAAVVVTSPGHSGRTYTLTGPRAVTHDQIAAALSAATRREVSFRSVPAEQFTAPLTGALPPWQVGGTVEDYAHYARGEAAEVHPDVVDLTGRPARDLLDFAHDHADAFARA